MKSNRIASIIIESNRIVSYMNRSRPTSYALKLYMYNLYMLLLLFASLYARLQQSDTELRFYRVQRLTTL